MKIEFEVPEEKVNSFSSKGKNELTRHCKNLAVEIIDETARIEVTSSNQDNEAKIPAETVDLVARYVRRFPANPKRSSRTRWLSMISFISSIFAGAFFNPDKFKDIWYLFIFLILLLVATISTFYLNFSSDSNGQYK